MSEMSLKKAYRVMQKHCGIEDGDTVDVLRVPNKADRRVWPNSEEYGYTGAPVGKRTEVSEVRIDNHIGIRVLCNKAVFPWWCLELVEKAKPELPAGVTFTSDGLKVGEVYLSKDTIRRNLGL